MGRGRVSASDLISVTEYHAFSDGKVADVRATTADATPATYTSAPPHCATSEFRPLDISDVIKDVKLLPDKQCSADPMATWRLKQCADVLAPFLCHMFNTSLQQGYVPSKSAFITPLLKKPDLDSADVKSYRPISNLLVLSKLLERLVARQLLDYLNAHHLLPDCQSAYRLYHSTETAILKVMSDILFVLDSGDLEMLTLLDLSAAFDTVDHYIILKRLFHHLSYTVCILS